MRKPAAPCTQCGQPSIQRGRCARHLRPNTTTRGYGHHHKRLREKWAPAVASGNVPCARCGQPITPAQPWDLGHHNDRTRYRGPEHAHCNRSACS